MAQLFDDDSRYLFYGVILIIFSVVFLLSSMGILKSSTHMIGEDMDILIAFLFMLIGAGMVFSAAGKPGKPKFDVAIKEITTGPN